MVITDLWERKNLTNLEKKIIDTIVEKNIPAISYHHPEIQLGKIAETDEIQSALHDLDYKFHALKLNTGLRFWFYRIFPTSCGYKVDMDVVGKIYKKAE